MTIYLLVHGGFTDGQYWEATASALRRKGHEVLIAQLPSNGTDPVALGGLVEDTTELRRLLDQAGAGVVLVGHSSGGMVITEVAEHPAIAHTVYVGAHWPERGQTLLETDGASGSAGFVVPAADGTAFRITDDWDAAHRHLYGDVPDRVAREAFGKLMFSSGAAALTPSSAPDRTHPTTYVVLEQDVALPTASQERYAARADRVERMASSHSPMLAHPEELAAILARVPAAVA